MSISIDIETRSSTDITHGVYKYAKNAEITLFGVAYGDEPVKVYDLLAGEKLPNSLIEDLKNPEIVKTAWNATFERLCINSFFGIDTKNWVCTQLKALTLGLPAALGKCAEVLDVEVQKMKVTIAFFCKPYKGKFRNPADFPEKWEEFKDYCGIDVEVERAINKVIDFVQIEQSGYDMNSDINDRGISIDMDLVMQAIELDEKFKAEYVQELKKITKLENPLSHKQFKEWLNDEGLNITSVAKAEKANNMELIKDSPEYVRRAFKLREMASMSSTAKYKKMVEVAVDGKLHGLLQFYGAQATGRFAGRLVQPQNLFKPGVDGEDLHNLREAIKGGSDMRWLYGDDYLAQAIRTVFISKERRWITAADFSAIEARVLSYLANETWRMEVFATHGKIYEAAAARMLGISIDDINKEQRGLGKVAELALGYQGGVAALELMGAKGTEAELQQIKNDWRRANPAICALWREVQVAAETAVLYTNCVEVHTPAGPMLFETYTRGAHEWLTIRLISGRTIWYYGPRFTISQYGNSSLVYRRMHGSTFVDTYGYGGKLVENIVQAVARDCLMVALFRAQAAGLKILFHVHDEIVVDGRHLTELIYLMEKSIKWAPGLILRADGYESKYYKK